MKIGILTHSLRYNYGGLLQNYALQQVLIKLGHEPITLNHQPRPVKRSIKLFSFFKRLFIKLRGKDIPINGFTTTKQLKYITRYINEFPKRCIITTNAVTLSTLKNADGVKDITAIIVGSDQVWRYKMMGQDILEMFLSSFSSDKIKKIAYAASFGTDNWEIPEKLSLKAKSLIKQFDSISVREQSAIRLCRDYLDTKAIHVLDPTLLLDLEDYMDIVKTSPFHLIDKPKSIMTYILDRNKNKTNILNTIVEKTGLSINDLLPQSKFADVGSKRIDDCVYASVEEWLKGFHDAEMVVTDSFHGTVFSIIFNKPFWVIGNESRGMARFESLLSLFDLQNRLITDVPRNIHENIDWYCVNKKLSELKIESIEFLTTNLK